MYTYIKYKKVTQGSLKQIYLKRNKKKKQLKASFQTKAYKKP